MGGWKAWESFVDNMLGTPDQQMDNPYWQEWSGRLGDFANQAQGWQQQNLDPAAGLGLYNQYLGNAQRAASDELLADFDKTWTNTLSEFNANENAWGHYGGDRSQQTADIMKGLTNSYTNAREQLWSDIGTRRMEYASPWLRQYDQNIQNRWNTGAWAQLQALQSGLGSTGGPWYTQQGKGGWLEPVMGGVSAVLPFLMGGAGSYPTSQYVP